MGASLSHMEARKTQKPCRSMSWGEVKGGRWRWGAVVPGRGTLAEAWDTWEVGVHVWDDCGCRLGCRHV